MAEAIHKCDICNDTYSSKANLNRHLHFVHKQPNLTQSRPLSTKCCLCDFACGSWQELARHCAEVHDLRLSIETLNFSSEDDFIKWRDKIEKESTTHFVKKRGTVKRKNGEVVDTFYCHRSGEFHPKGTGKRSLKINGTNKIGATCPSRIRMKRKVNKSIEVLHLKTHVGHTADLGRIPLTEDERKSVAAKLAQKIPVKEILNGVRDSICPDKLERIHLLTRKDILNIKDEYRSKSLNPEPKEKDADSVSITISGVGKRSSHSLLLKDKKLIFSTEDVGDTPSSSWIVRSETSVGETSTQEKAQQQRRNKILHVSVDTNEIYRQLVKNSNTGEELDSLYKIHMKYKAELEEFCLSRSSTTLFLGGENNPKELETPNKTIKKRRLYLKKTKIES